nr:transcription factor atf1 [Quercus suber]
MTSLASRSSTNNSPHLGNKSMTSSPRQSTVTTQSGSESKKETSPSSGNTKTETPTVPTIKPPEESNDNPTRTTNAPLAPPPKPSQTGNHQNDYFQGEHLSKEPNPFESAFGGGPLETPGKTQLPGVTSLTSPASLLPGNTPGWPGSLRSGPLSPAMLTGPTGSNDYFNSEHHFNGSFPTPNESSLRTGLTPGGGGSMFPQASPNSQALYNQLQSGGATPGTLDFHRTALNARAQSHANNFTMPTNGTTSQPQQNPNIQPDLDSKSFGQQNANRSTDNQDPFGSHQTNDAANGLFMLAQAGGQQRNGQQGFTMPEPPHQNYQQGGQQDPGKRGVNKGSIGSNMSGSTEPGQGEYSDGSMDAKPQTRGRGKKANNSASKSSGGKRKTDETPLKGANKKQRVSNGQGMSMDEPDDDEDMPDDMDEHGPDGKKMTDEEKRKNFLERNRVAALKCRQRKKQWLANLQQKVEIFSQENDALAATVTQLREEIVGLKTLLLAHKDCPVSQAQGISGMAMQQIAGDSHQQYANPYGMGMGNGNVSQQGQMGQAGMQRS